MSDFSLEQLQAAFSNKENRGGGRPSNYYPFWRMQEGQQAIVRFLPDANTNNPFGFLVEKLMHTLPINGETKSIPCLRMYEEDCPICKVSQQYYKEGDQENGKKYWRKKQHIGQALIVEDPLPEDESTGENHEGEVRFLAIGYQLFAVIKEAMESGELDEVPFAYEGGTNFIIKKTKQGDYPKYDVSSKFARKSSDLTEDEVAKVQDEIIDLSTLLPQKPEYERVESFLEASLTGAPIQEDTPTPTTNSSSSTQSSKNDDDDDDEEEEQQPAKSSGSAKSSGKKAAAKKTAAKQQADDSDDDADSDDTSDAKGDDEYESEADDILAQIRARRQQKSE